MLTTRNCHFNPRSLTGATFDIHVFSTQISISIHAPSRERRCCSISIGIPHIFQSTLPRGSDNPTRRPQPQERLFQSTLPRGSDDIITLYLSLRRISIHAPSRERRTGCACIHIADTFQSTLPRGSDLNIILGDYLVKISIHAPSRERLTGQITIRYKINFNPRSLAGATLSPSAHCLPE